jgi:hypothetical protein
MPDLPAPDDKISELLLQVGPLKDPESTISLVRCRSDTADWLSARFARRYAGRVKPACR